MRAAKVVEAAQIRLGLKPRPAPARVPTHELLKTVTDQFLANQKSRLSERGLEREKGIIDQHVLGYFDGRDNDHPNRTRAITVLQVEQYIACRLEAGVSPWTVRKEVNTMRHLFRYARKHGLADFNPAKDAELPPEPEARDRWLSADELKKILEKCPDWLKPIVLLGAFTGMRLGEILKLRRYDVDIKQKRVNLPKTKNRKPRRVFLNASALAVLSSLKLSEKGQLDLLFPDITQNRASVQYKRATRAAGVPDTRFHDLRHTTASHLHEQGLDDHTIARLLGQKSIKTARGYQGMSAQFLEKAAARLDGRLGSVLKDVRQKGHPRATNGKQPQPAL
jgi:integrase